MRFYFPFLAGVLLMAAVLLLASQLMGIDQAVKSNKWQPTQAQVIESSLAEKQDASYDKVDAAIRSWMLPKMFTLPKIGFSYQLGGTTYSSINYSFSIDPLGPSEELLQQQYPVGSQVTVFVDPENPKNSVLKPGWNDHFLMLVPASVVLILMGLYWITRPVKENVLR